MYEFLNEADVPDKCRGCAVQCETSAKLISLLLHKHLGIQLGESLVGEAGENLDAQIDEQVPEEIAEAVKHSLRQAIGDGLNNLDERISEAKQEMTANELSCSGVLRMRATKGDVSYTANICTSPRVYDRDAVMPKHLPVHVRADSVHSQN